MAEGDSPNGKEGDGVELARLFEQSNAFQNAAAAVLEHAAAPTTRRGFLALGFGAVSLEHWASQRLLLAEGLHVTGFALVRLQFEAIIRTIWILECADDAWLARFVEPMPDGQLEEPVLGPSVPNMLAVMAAKLPQIAGMLAELKGGAWAPMHSYVHGGVRPIVQSLAGVTAYQVSAVLRNANGLGLLAMNAMAIASGDPTLQGAIRQLQLDFLDCLPPLKQQPA